jgi:hypothetical protein
MIGCSFNNYPLAYMLVISYANCEVHVRFRIIYSVISVIDTKGTVNSELQTASDILKWCVSDACPFLMIFQSRRERDSRLFDVLVMCWGFWIRCPFSLCFSRTDNDSDFGLSRIHAVPVACRSLLFFVLFPEELIGNICRFFTQMYLKVHRRPKPVT